MPNSVRYYDSTMSGAPSLSGTAGALIGVLDACLVDGFGSVTVDSLVVASNVATATVSAGHQFAMLGTTGPVIRIAGATPSGLNTDVRVNVTSATQFTFATTGISDQTATGTITAKRAPAGFSKAFTGTNKAAYRSLDVASTQLYLRVDDTGTTNARVRGYEAMSDVDTGTGPFPTDAQLSGGSYLYKSGAASSAVRNWAIYSDGRIVYFFCDAGANAQYLGGVVFGDIASYAPGDAYHFVLIGAEGNTYPCYLYMLNYQYYSYLARRFDGIGSSIDSARYSHAKTGNYLGSGGETFPAPADNSFHLWPIEVWDSTVNSRGLLPGCWNPVHGAVGVGVNYGVLEVNGRTMVPQVTNNYRCVMDITGPWR